jgi:CRP-like cAMP-binding protein
MNKIHNTSIVDVYRNSPIFADSTENELKEASDLSNIKQFAKGETIFMEGDPGDLLYFVADGRVKIFNTSPSGKVFTLMVAIRGDPIISVHVFKEAVRRTSAMAMDSVTVVLIERTDYIKFALGHPHIAFNTINLVGRLLYSAHDRIMDLVGENVEKRLINVLCMLHVKFGKVIYFSSEELADLSGTTSETVRRTLGKLKKVGFIETGRGKIIVLNGDKLYKLCTRPYII